MPWRIPVNGVVVATNPRLLVREDDARSNVVGWCLEGVDEITREEVVAEHLRLGVRINKHIRERGGRKSYICGPVEQA